MQKLDQKALLELAKQKNNRVFVYEKGSETFEPEDFPLAHEEEAIRLVFSKFHDQVYTPEARDTVIEEIKKLPIVSKLSTYRPETFNILTHGMGLEEFQMLCEMLTLKRMMSEGKVTYAVADDLVHKMLKEKGQRN